MATDNEINKASKFNKKLLAPIIIDVIMLAIGICLLLWADKVISAISIAIGSIFVLYSVFNFISYARAKEKTANDVAKIITGIALAIAGVFLIMHTGFILELISFIVGIFIIIESMIHLQDAILVRKINPNYKTPLALSMIGVVCGVLCIVGKIMVPEVIMQLLGAMLIVFAFVDIFGVSLTNRKPAQSKPEQEAIEAEIVEKPEA